MISQWETPPHGKGRKVQVADCEWGGQKRRVMVRHVGRREYRIFLDGILTSYRGDTMAQAQAVANHVYGGMS